MKQQNNERFLVNEISKYSKTEDINSMFRAFASRLDSLYGRSELASMLLAMSNRIESLEARVSELENP